MTPAARTFKGSILFCPRGQIPRARRGQTHAPFPIYTILFMSPIFIGITDWKGIIEASRGFVCEYWFEDLNLRGSYKTVILQYVRGHYPEYYPLYERIYQKGDITPLTYMECEIISYCRDNKISFSDYFHHKDVISNPQNKVLGKNR